MPRGILLIGRSLQDSLRIDDIDRLQVRIDLESPREKMTTQQLHLMNGLYLVALVVVAFFTRATVRRILGALAGGVVFGAFALGMVALGEKMAWWQMALTWKPYFLSLMEIDFAISCAAIYLVTWRIARRFGWRGLAVVVVILTVIGPPRDRRAMQTFPEWGSYAPGIQTTLAIAAIYAAIVPLGHSMMRLIAGPSRGSPLARRPWEAAEPTAATEPVRHAGSS
jgi:hypothetical protein